MSESAPDFTVVTPSFNSLRFLPLAARSVADQAGVSAEHLVMDGGSTDGTVEWLQASRLAWVSERDRGMYDAVNKGLRRACGRFVAYLNADEQYLPGTLARVRDFFDRHPDVDVLFGSALLVGPDGRLLAYRKAYRPSRIYILANHLYVLSCAMFLRRTIVEAGLLFDPSFRSQGDADFVGRVLAGGFRADYTQAYLSTFTMTGANLSGKDARAETARLHAQLPAWARAIRPLLSIGRRVEKVLSGAYGQCWPLEYAIHVEGAGATRKAFSADRASFRWKTG